MTNLFDKNRRRIRSHGHRLYTTPKMQDVCLYGLPFKQKPLGLHHIPTKLYSIPLALLHSLYNTSIDTSFSEPTASL